MDLHVKGVSKEEYKNNESLEIENPFTRRVQSHEIMIMLFRGRHMGKNNTTACFMFNFSISVPPSFISSHLRLSYFMLHTPNKSWKFSFSSSQDFPRGLTCDSNAD